MAQTWDTALVPEPPPFVQGGDWTTGAQPAPQSTWLFVACALDGTPVADLGHACYERTVRHAFNGRLKTAAFRVRLDHVIADFLLSGEVLLKVYEDATLRFTGTLATYEEVASGDGGSVRLTFADAWFRLAQRLIGKDATGYRDGLSTSLKDKTALVTGILAAANTSGYTGIEVGTTSNTGSTSYAAFTPYKVASDAITELVNTLDGPDVEVVPVEPTANGSGVQIASLTVKAAIGQARPNAVFEYGAGKRNVATYSRRGDLTGLLNRAYNLAPQDDATATVAEAHDDASIATYGLAEGLVSADVGVQALRQSLVNEHVAIRKAPRVLVTFAPTRNDGATPGRVPQYGTDFFLGDSVPFRAVSEKGVVRVNASLRVYAVDWSIDDNGASLPSFTLTSE